MDEGLLDAFTSTLSLQVVSAEAVCDTLQEKGEGMRQQQAKCDKAPDAIPGGTDRFPEGSTDRIPEHRKVKPYFPSSRLCGLSLPHWGGSSLLSL